MLAYKPLFIHPSDRGLPNPTSYPCIQRSISWLFSACWQNGDCCGSRRLPKEPGSQHDHTNRASVRPPVQTQLRRNARRIWLSLSKPMRNGCFVLWASNIGKHSPLLAYIPSKWKPPLFCSPRCSLPFRFLVSRSIKSSPPIGSGFWGRMNKKSSFFNEWI